MDKAAAQAKIDRDVAAFLAGGGKVYKVRVQDNKWYRDKHKDGGQHIPLTIRQPNWRTPRTPR